MDVLNKGESAGEAFWDVRASASELEIYQGCMEHILKTADPEGILLITGCIEDHLEAYCEQFRHLILENVLPEFIPDRLMKEKGQEHRAAVEVLQVEEIATVCLFDLRVSEAQLKLLERCIDHILNTCTEEQIDLMTGYESHEELESCYEEVLRSIRYYVDPDYLPHRPPHDDWDEEYEDDENDEDKD